MVEIPDIEDRESLEAWLKDQPRETALWIASRAAARVLLVWWRVALRERAIRDPSLGVLSPLRCLLMSSVAIEEPSEDMRRAAATASKAAANVEIDVPLEEETNVKLMVGDTAYNLFGAVAKAAAETTDADTTAVSAVRVLYNYTRGARAWEAVRTDCAALAEGEPLAHAPLWPGRANPLQDRWDAVTARLRDAPPPGGPWVFWREWYQGLLDGTTMDPGLLTRIALIDPEHWDAGPERVNPMIAEMVAEHAAARTPNAERIVENPETERLRLEAVSDLPPDRLSEIRAKMLDAAEIFGETVEGNQPYSALSAEVELVRNAAASEDVRPIRLYDVCRRAVRRTQRKAALGECPENDALVEDWLDQLGEAALDLGEGDRRVQEVVAARAAARLRQASPEEAAIARDGAIELAQLAEGELAEELEADADTVADADASSEDRREAQYRLTSRLTRVWLGARRVLRETREVSGDVAGITLNVAKIVGASAAIKKAVDFLSSLV